MLVYKYRGGAFDRDLAALEQSYFWSANIDSLNDPCEAISDRAGLEKEFESLFKIFGVSKDSETRKSFQSLISQVDTIIDSTIKLGVFSLSKSYVHHLLWAHYADSHKGYCVEYDLSILQKQLNSFGKYFSIDVIYSDKPAKIQMDDVMSLREKGENRFLQKIIGTKPTEWAYEAESRLVTDNFGKYNYDFRAVKSIYFGLKMPDKEKEALMNRMKGRGVSYYQIVRRNNSYELYSTQVLDAFASAERYLYSIAPVQEEAIVLEEVKSEWKSYAHYLAKAVEIQRREPYCTEVCNAGFSTYNSKPNNPVIFVNYKFDKEGYMNRSFSISELDKLHSLITDL
jgi:hypothetical protein